MLPRENVENLSTFESFEAARGAIERIVPYQTTVTDLKALGFDVSDSGNVVQIPYPGLINRLVPDPNTPQAALDPGIRDCIAARDACRAYEFRMGHLYRKRDGGFWADFFNFRRVTAISGWRFEGLIVVRDGVVLFRNFGGEPRIERSELQVNPLGPLQSGGEAAGQLLVR